MKEETPKLKEICPNFYAVGEKIGRERFEKVPPILLCVWVMLPLYIMIRFAIEQIGLDEKFYGVELAMYVWYQPLWHNVFHLLGWITIVAALGCLIAKAINSGSSSKMTEDGLLKDGGSGVMQIFRNNIWFAFLVVLLIWAFICSAMSGHFVEEWHGSTYRDDGLFAQLTYAGIFICAGSIKDKEWIRKIFDIFALLANLTAIIVICQYYEIEAVTDFYPFKRASVFYQFNHCGYYLAMGIVTLCSLYLYETSKRKQVVYAVSIALQFAALIYNNTFGCYLAVLIAMPFIYIIYKSSGRELKWEKFIPLVLMAVLTAALFKIVLENFTTLTGDVENIVEGDEDLMQAGTGRMTLWINAIERISRSPIFGYGAEGFYFCFPNSPYVDRPHCEFIQYAAWYGIPGLIMYLGALISIFVRRIKELDKLDINILIAAGSMFVYLASSCFGNTMFYTTPYFFLFFGLVAHNLSQEKL